MAGDGDTGKRSIALFPRDQHKCRAVQVLKGWHAYVRVPGSAALTTSFGLVRVFFRCQRNGPTSRASGDRAPSPPRRTAELPAPFHYTPGSDEHGPRFLTGGPGAAPGGVASKNRWVYMRVQGGFNFLYPFCPSVCRKTAVGVEKWLARKVARLPRQVAESTPRPKGRWVC